VLVASRKYLDANGSPRRIEDLQHHAALLFRMPTSGRDRPWHFRQASRDMEFRPASRVRGSLVEVLRTLRPTPTLVLAVYPGARLVPPRVRAFVSELKALAL
jgi:DNA-binding transcriptional LysR family regulator